MNENSDLKIFVIKDGFRFKEALLSDGRHLIESDLFGYVGGSELEEELERLCLDYKAKEVSVIDQRDLSSLYERSRETGASLIALFETAKLDGRLEVYQVDLKAAATIELDEEEIPWGEAKNQDLKSSKVRSFFNSLIRREN